MAEPVGVGGISKEDANLIEATRKALFVGIAKVRAGNHLHDIGCAIEKFVKSLPFKYGIVEELGGHAVGYAVHEEPYIPNFCMKERGPALRPGAVLALEPMLNFGTKHVVFDTEDDYTVRTADGKKSAHFEHTILVTEGDPEILTSL